MKLIRLTTTSDLKIYLNMDKLISMCRIGEKAPYTILVFVGDIKYHVKETAEDITESLRLMKGEEIE